MKTRRFCWFLAATLLHVLSLVCAAKNPKMPFLPPHKTQTLDSPRALLDPVQGGEMKEGLSKLGSRPPNCEHKCGRCKPCVAIQVPTTSSRSGQMGVQYANYEPEGWKCKCGAAVFEP